LSTPRLHYRIDIFEHNAPQGEIGPVDALRRSQATLAKQPGPLTDWYCPHTVRATSTASAKRKALAAHVIDPACRDFEESKRHYLWAIITNEGNHLPGWAPVDKEPTHA
jgi:hypothetical protein